MSVSGKITSAVAIAVSLSSVAAVSPGVAMAGESRNASAGVNGSCDYREESFTVPQGKTAVGFAFDFKPGQRCGAGGEPDITGFAINTGGCGANPANAVNVYTYTRSRGQGTGVPRIETLTLQPGSYCLSFDGGRWGYVQLNYSLVP